MGAVVTAGAVATAIGAIVALWPDPPAELRAELSDVKIDRNVTLYEWELRHGTESAWAPSGAAELLLAADVVAQAEIEGGTTAEIEEGTTSTDGTTTEDGTTTDEDGVPDGDGDIVREPRVSNEERAQLNEGLDRALDDPAVSPTDVGETCGADLSDPDCGLRSTLTYLLSPQSEVSAVTVADQLVKLFVEGLRKQPPPPDEGQPVGVTTNFNVSLTGFRGRGADVRWSLYDAGGGRVPLDWVRDQHVLSLEAEAQEDSGSGEFWVPLPRVEGPFFVRFGVYDEDDDRLDYEDTRRFP